MSWRDVQRQAERLMAGMEECERLDRAAGEQQPGLSISEWVAARMRSAVERAKEADHG